jgi:hypothetical protein
MRMRGWRQAFGILALSGCIQVRGPAGAPPIALPAKLKAIEVLLSQGRQERALALAIESYRLPSTECASFVLEAIDATDPGGEVVVARTNFDQVVRLDPAREAFRNARMLVLTLAHEIEHCAQHQRLYAETIEKDARFARLRSEFPRLRDLALRVGQVPAGDPLLELESLVSLELARYAGWLPELFEVGALLKALEVKEAVSPPELEFHKRYMEIAQRRLLLRRGVKAGSSPDQACKSEKALPPRTAREYEELCSRGLRLLE